MSKALQGVLASIGAGRKPKAKAAMPEDEVVPGAEGEDSDPDAEGDEDGTYAEGEEEMPEAEGEDNTADAEGEEADPDAEDEETAPVAKAVRNATARAVNIMKAGADAGQTGLAEMLAMDTSISAKRAVGMIAAAGSPAPGKASSLASKMAGHKAGLRPGASAPVATGDAYAGLKTALVAVGSKTRNNG